MKSRLIVVLIGIAMLAASSAFAAQNSASKPANANAGVITKISLAKVADLNFGDVVADAASTGTVVVDTSGTRTATTVTLGGGTPTAASFTVGGQASATYTITLPGSLSITDGGANSMTVNAFTSNPSGTGALDLTGAQTLAVGATLNVGVGQATGTYTAAFSVTVAYN